MSGQEPTAERSEHLLPNTPKEQLKSSIHCMTAVEKGKGTAIHCNSCRTVSLEWSYLNDLHGSGYCTLNSHISINFSFQN